MAGMQVAQHGTPKARAGPLSSVQLDTSENLAGSQHDVQHDTFKGQGSLAACHLEAACLVTARCPEGSG